MLNVLTLLLLCSTAPASAVKIGSGEYLRSKCAQYAQHYKSLVRSQLDGLPFNITFAGLSQRFPPEHHEHTRLSDEAYGWPVLYIVDGALYVEK